MYCFWLVREGLPQHQTLHLGNLKLPWDGAAFLGALVWNGIYRLRQKYVTQIKFPTLFQGMWVRTRVENCCLCCLCGCKGLIQAVPSKARNVQRAVWKHTWTSLSVSWKARPKPECRVPAAPAWILFAGKAGKAAVVPFCALFLTWRKVGKWLPMDSPEALCSSLVCMWAKVKSKKGWLPQSLVTLGFITL